MQQLPPGWWAGRRCPLWRLPCQLSRCAHWRSERRYRQSAGRGRGMLAGLGARVGARGGAGCKEFSGRLHNSQGQSGASKRAGAGQGPYRGHVASSAHEVGVGTSGNLHSRLVRRHYADIARNLQVQRERGREGCLGNGSPAIRLCSCHPRLAAGMTAARAKP